MPEAKTTRPPARAAPRHRRRECTGEDMIETVPLAQSDRRALAVFRPDVILPVQLFAALSPPPIPEKRLMIAILVDAIDCFRKYRLAKANHGRRVFGEAQEWFMDENSDALLASADRSILGNAVGSMRAIPMVHAVPLMQLRPCPVTEPPPAPAN